MGISHSKHFLYLVIPKTGSATVRHAVDPFREVKRTSAHFSEHVPLHRLAVEHLPLLDTYFSFSFVRNPYDRLYSGYLQDKWAAENLDHWRAVKKPIFEAIGDDFNRYIQEYVATADRWNDPDWICFCPMHAFTHIGGKQRLNFVGRTETLERDLAFLSHRLGLDLGAIESKNVSSPPSREGLKYLHHYSPESLRLVNGLYAQDFAYFGYQPIEHPSSANLSSE